MLIDHFNNKEINSYWKQWCMLMPDLVDKCEGYSLWVLVVGNKNSSKWITPYVHVTHVVCTRWLTLSLPIPLRLYTLPCWPNPQFLIFDIWTLWILNPELQSGRMSKIKNCGLDQYGAEPFEQQQFQTAGIEGVNSINCMYFVSYRYVLLVDISNYKINHFLYLDKNIHHVLTFYNHNFLL